MGQIKKEKSVKYSPVLLNPSVSGDKKKIRILIHDLPSANVIDKLTEQIEELYLIRNPHLSTDNIDKAQLEKFQQSLILKVKLDNFGLWVFYPWNNFLVHYLPEKLHLELLTARNRNLITEAEQNKYYNSTVGIAGLSIGNSVVGTLLHTGGPKYIKLADFDTLSASNINRIRTGFTNLGLKKAEIAAREVNEVNPYAELAVYNNGLNKNNLDKFLRFPHKLNILVEEMDNIYLKIQIRLLARKYRIPVIMAADNGDNISLDVERFDLDPYYPILHGDVPEKELFKVTPKISKMEAARIITRWVHPENVSLRMQQSLMELGKTLYSWPQLGTAAFLSGVSLAYAYRKIISGENLPSGKYQVSLDNSLLKLDKDRDYHYKYLLHTKQFVKMLNL